MTGGATQSLGADLERIPSGVLHPPTMLKALFILIVGVALAKLAAKLAESSVLARRNKHVAAVAGKLVFYFASLVILLLILDLFRVHLTHILAAAGILSVAAGFAAQTSFANIISGIFLLVDKPFEVEHFIKVGETSGTVLSIDLLSTKLRTLDGVYVRIPNETLVKSAIINFTQFGRQRLSLAFPLAPDAGLKKAQSLLLKVARENLSVLKDPAPSCELTKLDLNAVTCTLWVWVQAKDQLVAQTSLLESGLKILNEGGVPVVTLKTLSSV